MKANTSQKFQIYQITLILSLMFTLVGFSYNVWRMEATEDNNNVRTASFELLKELSSLEQLIYAAYYDNDTVEGSPRKGWVTVGLIVDLSNLTNDDVQRNAIQLKTTWSENWSNITSSQESVDHMVVAIDLVRLAIKDQLKSLE